MSNKKLFPAEFIFPGHPDKLCDAIADALVHEARRRDRRALVGVEVAVHRDHAYLTGRIACPNAQDINVTEIVRQIFRSAGYGDGWYPSPDQVQVVGFLPDHVILSGFRVTPVVALVQPQAVLRWDPAEVAGAFELPLAVLLDASQHSVGSRLINDVPVVTRDILYGPHRIWGATAAMLFCLRTWAVGEELS